MIDKDILVDFQTEANQIIDELEQIVEALEEAQETFPSQLLAGFAQRVDRIMGAAQTMGTLDPNHKGLQKIGAIAQICKQLGYKASQFNLAALLPFFAAFWADTLEVMKELVENVGDEAKSGELADSFAKVLESRLQWLGERVKKMAPEGAALGVGSLDGQGDILQMLKK